MFQNKILLIPKYRQVYRNLYHHINLRNITKNIFRNKNMLIKQTESEITNPRNEKYGDLHQTTDKLSLQYHISSKQVDIKPWFWLNHVYL